MTDPIAASRRGPAARRAPQPRRVQRPTQDLPVLHLEAQVPSPKEWGISIDGMVELPRSWPLHELDRFEHEERIWDLHCVWGWSRAQCRWGGVSVGTLLERARPNGTYVLATASGGQYASCLTMEEARASLVATTLDGAPLSPEHGGPLRLVPPPTKWAYKGVKWVSELFVLQTFTPGAWETLVGDPHGTIPDDKLDLRFEE